MNEVRRLVAEEYADLLALLRGLTDEQWRTPSLCAGWRVRDVVGHLVFNMLPVPAYVGAALRHRSADRINAHLVGRAAELSTGQLLDRFESWVDGRHLGWLLPWLALADVLVHQQDIRRPLGLSRPIPAERLVQTLRRPDPFAQPGRRMRGLRFEATDVPWSSGAGPLVRGCGEALALAVAGRAVVLDELTGDGVTVLRGRV